MRKWSIFTLMLAATASATLAAQEPHVGFGINLIIPTGGFSSTTYDANDSVLSPQKESYDIGLGGQFTISFPVDPHVAFRADLFGQAENGTNRAQGYETLNLRHQLFGIGGSVQVFPGDGSAYRQRGLYFLGGLSADFERFGYSHGDPNYDYTDTTNKSRMGLRVGLGHIFGYGGGPRFSVEGLYHTSLTGHNADNGEPPSTDYVQLGFGWVF